MRALPLLLLAASLPACVWVSDEDVADRYAELTDADGDGYQDVVFGGDDCDDGDAAVHPGATETCNGVDDDCSGSADDELKAPWYPDDDGDGYGDAGGMTITCDPASGLVDNGEDCDDGAASVHPGADEYCNGIDDDCDDETDEDDAEDASTFYADSDGDGYGDVAGFAFACEAPTGFVDDASDCDDDDDAVHPGAEEYCNGIDDDCDDSVDEAGSLDALAWYADDDRDGYGDPDTTVDACTAPSGYTDDATDCDDGDDAIHPGGLEVLGDDDDGDCDGSDDGFGFLLHDTRSASSVRGPRLAQGSGQVYLGWAAEELDHGGSLYDAVAVSVFSDEDPLDPERDFEAIGSGTNQAILGRFDLVANDTLWVAGSSWIDLSTRTIRLDAVNAGSGAQGRYSSVSDWTVPFDQLQLGLSLTFGNITAVGCGEDGAGLQAVQVNAANVISGTAIPGADTVANDPTDDHDTCEYDHVNFQFYMGTSAGRHLNYYSFDFDDNLLYSTHSDTGTFEVTDIEVSTAHGWRAWVLADLDGGNNLYTAVSEDDGGSPNSVWSVTAEPMHDLDVALSPAGTVYLCTVDDDGDARLMWNEMLGYNPPYNALSLSAPVLGTIEECAITVTADSVAFIALRSGDDIATAVVEVP